MKAIEKLKIIFGLIIFSVIVTFLYINIKKNFIGGLIYAVLIIIFFVLRYTLFKDKFRFDYNYDLIPIGYTFGGISLLTAIMASFGTMKDLTIGHTPSLGWLLLLLGSSIFGVLLIYFSYQSKQEFSQNKKLKEKTKKICINKKQRIFWITYLMTSIILLIITRYVFRLTEFTLINIIMHAILIILLYFLLRIIFSRIKK